MVANVNLKNSIVHDVIMRLVVNNLSDVLFKFLSLRQNCIRLAIKIGWKTFFWVHKQTSKSKGMNIYLF